MGTGSDHGGELPEDFSDDTVYVDDDSGIWRWITDNLENTNRRLKRLATREPAIAPPSDPRSTSVARKDASGGINPYDTARLRRPGWRG